MFKRIIDYFDKLEDRIRRKLSRKPLLYAFIGGVGAVLFWRGVWHTTDFIMSEIFRASSGNSSLNLEGMPWWDGASSLVIGSVMLLMTGAFVSSFIGNEIIITGLKGEKKIAEKTEMEVIKEIEETGKLKQQVREISSRLSTIVDLFSAKKP
ncbi:MAG TPA: hypothetical protein DCX32_04210 [Candidatus Moranbacteria bacterium]|nr:MAG: hypothetical protein UW87_C0008G0009 [Candidatus Moranbacteria bacterium GW2011_GWC2_45_10]KKT93506.1 MAG: hypothetical protein UW95_C0022G0001 [Parcubacteria group bacterium GW2011_GWC1_45_14]HAV11711.1 hypothetical protein [Candidatus Moranbacteria bacterium]